MAVRNQQRAKEAEKEVDTANLMAPPALLDIAMPVYGEWSLAEEAIGAIPAALGSIPPSDYRLIVVDNATPPWKPLDGGPPLAPAEQAKGIAAMLRSVDRFVRLDTNVGYPGAVIEAFRLSSSPLLLVLTADVVLYPGAIDAVVREMDDPSVGVVGAKLLFPTVAASPHGPGGRVQHAGISFDIRGRPRHHYLGWAADHPWVNRRMEVAAVTGACLMTRRRLWTDLGGFDRDFGAGTFEDVAFCFAARAAQAKTIYCPNAVGEHVVGGAMLQGASRGFNLGMNATIFKGKYAAMLAWDEWRFF